MNLFSKTKPAEQYKFYTGAEFYAESNVQRDEPETSTEKTTKSREILRACLKKFSKEKKPATASDGDWQKKMRLLEMVSPRATRAEEFLSEKTRPESLSVSRWLAQDGLRCELNLGQNEYMSFAYSMIQHASGYYGPLSGTGVEIKPELLQKIDGLIARIDESVRNFSISSCTAILAEINKEFPNARLSVTVLDGNADKSARPHREIKNDDLRAGIQPNDVLLLWKDCRFEAIVADPAVIGSCSDRDSRKITHPLYDANIARALLATEEVLKRLDEKSGKAPNKHANSSSAGPAVTDPATLTRVLLPSNIERTANDASADLSLITGLLRHATGIYEKSDLPIAGQLCVTPDEPLHAVEARIILEQIDASSSEAERGIPIGSVRNDKRIPLVIELINERHGVELNLMLLEVRAGEIYKAGTYSEDPGEVIGQIDHPSKTCMLLTLLRCGDSFDTLRKSMPQLNPYLHPKERTSRKSTYGKSTAHIENFFSPFRRAARKLSDDELTAQCAVITSGHGNHRTRALQNELEKRTDVDRFDKGTQTLFERVRNGFREEVHNDNPYARRSAEELLKILKDQKQRPFLIRKEERLIKRAVEQKIIENSAPSHMQHPAPTPEPLISETKLATMNADFKHLRQTVSAKAIEEDWAEHQFDTGSMEPTPWGGKSVLHELEISVLHAWHHAQQGFIHGKLSQIGDAIDHLDAALEQFNSIKEKCCGSSPVKGTERLMTVGRKIEFLLHNLEIVKADTGVDPTETSYKTFKARDRIEHGLTTAEIQALANLRSEKTKVVQKSSQLRDEILKVLQPLNSKVEKIANLRNHIAPLTRRSTVAEVLQVADQITSTLKNELSNLQVRADETEKSSVDLKAVVEALNLCKAHTVDSDVLEDQVFGQINLTVAALIERGVQGDPQISLAMPVSSNFDIKSLSVEQQATLLTEVDCLQKVAEDMATQLRDAISAVENNQSDLKILINPVSIKQKEIAEISSRITALEGIDRLAADESRRKENGERQAALNAVNIQNLRQEWN